MEELAAALQATFDGSLGKQSTSLIARFISSKMPGGFSITTARKYLQTRWGLGPGRSDGALLFAITMEPAVRLQGEADAKALLDSVAKAYASYADFSLSDGASSASSAGSGNGGSGVVMDPAAMDALTKDQRALFKHQMELLARYLKMDLRRGDRSMVDSKVQQDALQTQLDTWLVEHGDVYASGIQPAFSPLKARRFDSSWNWARQDAVQLHYDLTSGKTLGRDRETMNRCIQLMNRVDPKVIEMMQFRVDSCTRSTGDSYQRAQRFEQQLLEKCQDALEDEPVYKDTSVPTRPQTKIDKNGTIAYTEVPREGCSTMEKYVARMAKGSAVSQYSSRAQVQNVVLKMYQMAKKQNVDVDSSDFKVSYERLQRRLTDGDATEPPISHNNNDKDAADVIPFVHLRSKSDRGWEYNKCLTETYLGSLRDAALSGVTYENKHVLITGAGEGSIGSQVLQGLISGGAKVIVTTSRYRRSVAEYYQGMYTRYGARGSQLVVVPYNQGSKQDVEALVTYIYDAKDGLGWDLDMIVPFAAISENGREIDSIDSKSELAHRILLTNLLRLLGGIKRQKESRGIETRPAQAILPLSPNHGTFGNDGLYSESKLALETLFHRWRSESWGSYIAICGAVIGWTRGTGLMAPNNIVAEGIEALGVHTFSQQEMAFNILGLMAPTMAELCQTEPVYADLNGGMQCIPRLNEAMAKLRRELTSKSETLQAVAKEKALESSAATNPPAASNPPVEPRANLKLGFPQRPDWNVDIAPLHDSLEGMVDLDRVVVVTGFAEVGPWGNSRTRWEMEAYGQFSLEGCVEMAWIMGLIRHHNGPLKGQPYAGWVDAKSGEAVSDKDIKAKYETYILEHAGLRLIEPELVGGYDPNKKQMLQEVIIEEGLDAFETSQETAEHMKLEHGDKVDMLRIPETGEYMVYLKKGASLWIPKALRFDRLVAGQIPTGWDAKRYGVPEDIASQVDPVTLYNLVCTAEALLCSGVTDPYEFYKYVHVSEVGSCVGSGTGGASALKSIYRGRFQDQAIQNDVLQESFSNTMAAWVNMLLLSSSGPIKTPVGACATSVESIDMGHETIVQGKAKVCLVGGFDDFGEEGSYEFANMKATNNTVQDAERGREPSEMSRPSTTTRDGFVESHGCGVQILMSAQLALDMGVPIYAILAYTATASDKIGRSVPAPGKGALTTARERATKFPSPLLDVQYRKRQLQLRRKQIAACKEEELQLLQDELATIKTSPPSGGFDEAAYMAERLTHIDQEALRREKDLAFAMGNNFWKEDAAIAPLRGALATWGLTIDDLQVASFHGTSTQANDKNESSVVHQQLQHLGRTRGNAVLGIFQKYLTGHSKGAAGAFMFNGCLQVMDSGLVPGNRNADNVDEVMKKYDLIVYPNRAIQTDGVKAFSVTSFGFGQKGTQAVGVHPKYLFATLDPKTYQRYCAKVDSREKKAQSFYNDGLIHNRLFVAKPHAPYTDEQMSAVLLDPTARVTENKAGELVYATRV